MTGVRPPALDAARRRAAELIVPQNLDAALAAPRIAQQLTDSLSIFRLTGGSNSPLPRLLLPGGILHGGSSTEQNLLALLRRELSIPKRDAPAQPPSAPQVFSAQQIT